ncbi:hypothetical protein CAPN010_19340 [Capnocytophaga cynodegmi]|uniref:ATP-binding protein n=1 Tax=Capnocytophaga cynodegmi TaxID=28189 RepID=UPI001EE17988|nr:AAA family ATPase [Capnocytophaga cynodegmi]GJQ07776.1 hypothetical protein CAPN010_19340 [Capnocytophaga cynodegmi]
MDYSEKVSEIVQRIKQTVEEIQPDFYFLENSQKIQSSLFIEIKVSNRISIFVDNKLGKNMALIDALIFRKDLILRDFKEFIKYLPNVYILKDKEYMDKLNEEFSNNSKQEDIVFRAQTPKYSLNRVILPPQVKNDIILSLTLIENQKRIYDDWGFSEVDAKPKLILNFYGAPGTGKTMVAHAVAEVLNKKILSVNYAEIESKYVGDAPKNLFKAFNVAKTEQSVLFFDEADSFLGKRIESVSNSSDQAINSLRSQMLILLEDFEGVVIFATNLVKNYDKAFESRILKHIHFELPTFENREQIIKITVPSKVPFSENVNKDDLYKKLAEISEGFSGREIKNAVLESLTIAVQEGSENIEEDIFIKGFEKIKDKLQKLEQEKGKKIPLSKELKEKIESGIKEQMKSEKLNEVQGLKT